MATGKATAFLLDCALYNSLVEQLNGGFVSFLRDAPKH
jgi:hypothetical protein